MPRLSLVAILVCAAGLLAGCQTAPPGGGAADGVTPNAVAGDAIDVTALDVEPPVAKMVDILPGGATEGTGDSAGPAVSGAGTATKTAAPEATPAALAAPAAGSVAEPDQPDTSATPAQPKSERQLACEKKQGRWAKVGKGDARACVFQTRDAGKRCTRESQCEGACLARSGTCAPFRPMYGCNEVLQDNGMRVTLCLE